jgi:integrase-like protein
MSASMTALARRELVEALRQRYAAATREEKVRILSEFALVSGLHRKSAIRVLNAEAEAEASTKRAGRPRIYDQAVQQALVTLWEASDRVCGKRLKALLPTLLQALERHGHMAVDPKVKAALLTLSAATMDRLLAPTRAVACSRRKPRAQSRPKRKMPLRTFADWGEARIGEMEIDLVTHCGPVSAGSYVSSLVMTDVVSGWTECAPVVVRSRELIVETLERVRQTLPFPLVSLDTDNGVEFVNEVLVDYCAKHGIGLTRSRPYLKNDQAWIEQKNGAVVRRMVGYARLEGIAAGQGLARLYASTRLFVNFFQPSFKLATKHREGSRIIKRYLAPMTPCARLLASEGIPAEIRTRLKDLAESLDPLRLLDEIRTMQHHLAALAKGERTHTPIARAADLTEFLGSLALAWKAGEVRPTHATKPRSTRRWRTRADAFLDVWPIILEWLEAEPDQTGIDLLARLQSEYPGRFPDGKLRTLQRRLADWRLAASSRLVFRDLHPQPPLAAPQLSAAAQ